MLDIRGITLKLKAEKADLERELYQLEISAEAQSLAIMQIVDGFTSLIEMNIPKASEHMAVLLRQHRRALEIRDKVATIVKHLEG